ncbi:hypothetical protein GPECTOR_608g690 [Gonium pectorale]|uniref:Glycosyl transferase CAP10 domain-containing protein n=1 Tax=Gonium pectorale TaxID=33097 RepID=A0A150FUH9_GONPE|nr:hypothetical protein GPECTOR_608g690 [Gonium pectorale]|eukprot:KXZ41246.1 hypothetical protein GPECTOR_608g690 [Gonium pectorale]
MQRSDGCGAGAGGGKLPEECEQYAPLYESIDRDLELFKRTGGITPRLMAKTIKLHSAGNKEKGLAVAFYNGRVFVISNTREIDLGRFGHHVSLWVAYLRAMLHLEETHGSALPNVEFVWHTIDRPTRLINTSAGGVNYPVLRFGKSAAHPDILVPNFHFYQKLYQTAYLDAMPARAAARPWAARTPVAFARFSAYDRYVHPNDTHTQRARAGDRAPLCVVKGRGTAICPVRSYLHDWAANHTILAPPPCAPPDSGNRVRCPALRAPPASDRLDVNKHRHVAMEEFAGYRYLLHVDGQGLSSRLEFLLTLGSLVLKEESGYVAYYHHLLRPYEHYVPVWKAGSGPEDILEAVDWARAHDAEAQRIAAAGQAFAARHLSAQARVCFWQRLFLSYAAVMTYDPVSYRNITMVLGAAGAGAAGTAGRVDVVSVRGNLPYIKPARRFLAEEVTRFNPRLLQDEPWEP